MRYPNPYLFIPVKLSNRVICFMATYNIEIANFKYISLKCLEFHENTRDSIPKLINISLL